MCYRGPGDTTSCVHHGNAIQLASTRSWANVWQQGSEFCHAFTTTVQQSCNLTMEVNVLVFFAQGNMQAAADQDCAPHTINTVQNSSPCCRGARAHRTERTATYAKQQDRKQRLWQCACSLQAEPHHSGPAPLIQQHSVGCGKLCRLCGEHRRQWQ